MAKLKFYLDTRAVANGHPAPLKLAVSNNCTRVFALTGIRLLASQWNEVAGRVMNHPQRKKISTNMAIIMASAEGLIKELKKNGRIKKMTAQEIKELLVERGIVPDPKESLEPAPKPEPVKPEPQRGSFVCAFEEFIGQKSNERTADIYKCTLKRLRAYCRGLDKLNFEDITFDWLKRFEAYMAQSAPTANARNIHLRNIRAVFNYAIDMEITKSYPFRRLKIKAQRTKKRNLTIDQLRQLFALKLDPVYQKYLDVFLLDFMLIGINTIDLLHLEHIDDGRIEYDRAKTGRHYSIKVEPEAAALISKLAGKKYLIYPVEHHVDYRNYTQKVNAMLKQIVAKLDGFPQISMYWARHSWASVAAYLDIPKEAIAAALGHGGNTVTDIYINYDSRKVDRANRMVLDYVLYGKGGPLI